MGGIKPNAHANKKSINIGTFNVRALRNQLHLIELEEAFNNSEMHILGLAETRRKEEKILKTKSSNLLFHTDSEAR